MKKLLLTIAFAAITGYAFSTILIVDINGAGQFTSIQLAINNAVAGDTIQVWPGTYMEAVNLSKNLVLQGSGYENTIITGTNPYTLTISNGIMKWFMISSTGGASTGGRGINISGGKVTNCIIKGCGNVGIFCNNGTNGIIQNCIIINNGSYGIYIDASSAALTVFNTISRNNTLAGFYANYGNLYRLYCDGSTGGYGGSINGNQGCLDSDPIFVSNIDYHLSSGSPCFDTGQPSLSDPDGSRSDMGYFGGPDCPIFPVVYEMKITPSGSNINVQAKARANY
jgi:hypothetical protein